MNNFIIPINDLVVAVMCDIINMNFDLTMFLRSVNLSEFYRLDLGHLQCSQFMIVEYLYLNCVNSIKEMKTLN